VVDCNLVPTLWHAGFDSQVTIDIDRFTSADLCAQPPNQHSSQESPESSSTHLAITKQYIRPFEYVHLLRKVDIRKFRVLPTTHPNSSQCRRVQEAVKLLVESTDDEE